MGSIIKKIEYIFPKTKISNEDLSHKYSDYDFSKFEEKVGIKNRYWVNEDETALDLAETACLKLFEDYDKNRIEYIIYCTQSPEYILPTTACILQDRLGLPKSIGAFDYNLGCSGYVYGLSLAKGLIESGQVETVLLVTAETYSKYLNEEDKSNRAIFGDAATATIIEKSTIDGLGNFLFGTDGSGAEKLIVRNGATKHKFNESAELKSYGTSNLYTDNNLYMNGPEIFNFTSENVPNFTKEVLEKGGLNKDDVDYFVFHQANSFMLNFLRKRIKIDENKFYNDLRDGGNTVSNTIPIALKRLSEDLYKHESKLNQIVIVGFGVGLSWAGGIIKIENKL